MHALRTPFSRISLDFPLSVIASLYAELLTIFPAISAHHISRRMKGKRNKDFPSSSRESRGKVLVLLAFLPLLTLTSRQGKPREIHVKRVHNTCISHQFPQGGKSLMPVVCEWQASRRVLCGACHDPDECHEKYTGLQHHLYLVLSCQHGTLVYSNTAMGSSLQ